MSEKGQSTEIGNKFSRDVLLKLEEAGWCHNRLVNIDKHITGLRSDSYDIFPSVRSFLEQFADLHVDCSFIDAKYGPFRSRLHFDAASATAAVYPQMVARYSGRLQVPLCIIGEYDDITLVMTPEGKVYGGFEDDLAFYGETGEQAIINIINRENILPLS